MAFVDNYLQWWYYNFTKFLLYGGNEMKEFLRWFLIFLLTICLLAVFFALGFYWKDIQKTKDVSEPEKVISEEQQTNSDENDDIVGFYYSENYLNANKSVYLQLNEDGTCLFPQVYYVGNKAYFFEREGTWELNEDAIIIYLSYIPRQPNSVDTKDFYEYEAKTKTVYITEEGVMIGSYFFEKK